ncbi:MAG: hypothetical protein OCD01_01905 [Fibrobacterales bacterium]
MNHYSYTPPQKPFSKSLYKVILLLLFFVTTTMSFANDIVIVVSKSSTLTSIQVSDLKKLYIGKNTTIDKTFTSPIIQKNKTEHKLFLEKYLHMNTRQFARTWQKLVFTGKAQMPQKANSSKELIKYLTDSPHSIGYMLESRVTPEVKIVPINGL